MKESETNIDVHMGNRRRKTHYFHKECINKWCPKNEKLPLCGNSIWVDRLFLKREMPKLETMLHYRMIDVSSIKELAKRWYGKNGISPEKKSSHRALDDIVESVNELKWYKANIFQ